MNRISRTLLHVTVTLLAVLTSARAQTDTNGVRELTLSEARNIAFQRNWDLLAARSGIDLAAAQLLMAKEFPNPNASVSTAKIGERENSTPEGNGIWARSYDTIFAVNQLFEIGGKRRDRQASAQAGLLGAKAQFLDAKRVLDQGVTKAYVAALLADENERVLHQSSDYMRHEQEIAETRFKAGDLAEADLKQIQVAAEQYVLQENAAEAAAVQARTAVQVLLGDRQPKGDWKPVDSLEDVAGVPAEVVTKTNGLRSDVLAAKYALAAAEQELKLQKAERIPDPTIALQYEHNPPGGGPPVDTIGLGVSFPLPIWNQNKGAINSARATVDQSRFALAKLQAQMVGDLINAHAAYTEATNRLARYREQIRRQSAYARDAVIFKFNKGGATLVDLLEAERTDNDVRLATAQAMADTASTAADLAAASTAFTESDLSAIR